MGTVSDIQPQIAIENNQRKQDFRRQEILNKLRYVEIIVED